ncbi:rod shape-determining protein [Candidatus Shapirobacteria bacterium CG03_land_8_20_14_0_80_35_14]|uniref:Cell shape-determining protein MreB n=1 Tax=Candidatus Shapirobacteria bacterium CG03_land_8_20_14_0_80_35_14 TaxID=1974878 RepID=A0A2M7BQ67_9BACT|nr:MAG: rod shape-determining protein [Candidatus Shapirobacteria bacterium CG03_land_8_20_14_0_80_35_14]
MLAIDIGTSEIIILRDGDVVLQEPAVVAVDVENRKRIAIGSEAKKMMGRSPEYIEVIEPIRSGVIVDYEGARLMLKSYLQDVMGRNWFVGPEVITAVPCGNTQVEQRAVIDVLLEAGARKVYLIDAPLAAAIGAKVPISDVFGNMIVNLGGGVIEVAVIASGGIVKVKQIRQGGGFVNDLIFDYLVSQYLLAAGKQVLEDIKIKLLSVVKLKKEEFIDIGGRDLLSGLPKKIKLSSTEVYELVRLDMEKIVTLMKSVLEATSAELVSDIIDRGVILTGAFAKTRGLDLWLSREIGIPVHVALEPEFSVVRGIGMVTDNWDLYRQSLR